MSCNCLEDFDTKLKERNTRLGVTLCIPRDSGPATVRPTIVTEKVEPRKKGRAVTVLPTFCPFCGERYEPAPAKPAEG